MAKSELRDLFVPTCPIRNVLSRIGDKWTMLVLYTLSEKARKLRFGELRRLIPDVSQKSLTNTLRTLEEDGLVLREIYAEVPPRVEYSLTPRALSLFPHIQSLIDWAKENMDDIVRDRARAQKDGE